MHARQYYAVTLHIHMRFQRPHDVAQHAISSHVSVTRAPSVGDGRMLHHASLVQCTMDQACMMQMLKA